ncbi:MAG: transposase [Candidatus Omnitrophica bacterium]|nr:transposase [Candidatus Omnitrophota bacterium]
MVRTQKLITGQVYHVFSRTIAKYVVFHNDYDYIRMAKMIEYYQYRDRPISFSKFDRMTSEQIKETNTVVSQSDQKLVQIIAYCSMPTHIHLVLKQTVDNGISDFVRRLLNSYARYFNTKYDRKGPLWEARFKNVRVETDDQLLHLTRYVHLNPVTAYLTNDPADWRASSYKEYVSLDKKAKRMCEYGDLFEIRPAQYLSFVQDRVFYQRDLAKIKHLLFDEDESIA